MGGPKTEQLSFWQYARIGVEYVTLPIEIMFFAGTCKRNIPCFILLLSSIFY